ncbi:hypothetical protein [Gorillibacterium massiliense]|uniref:hypothetical protein n=1 Tax=Gorillibacterium massiliense TaxID=1280390 RepID=UPI001EE1AB2B|nr:hypothetical protein [Gorillibacterium massiliense]
MYFDYLYQTSYFYLVAVIFPVLFIRKYKELLLVFLLTCVVSVLLVHVYIPETQAYFIPFDRNLEVLVVFEAFIFGIIQVLFVALINYLKNTMNK